MRKFSIKNNIFNFLWQYLHIHQFVDAEQFYLFTIFVANEILVFSFFFFVAIFPDFSMYFIDIYIFYSNCTFGIMKLSFLNFRQKVLFLTRDMQCARKLIYPLLNMPLLSHTYFIWIQWSYPVHHQYHPHHQ